MDKYNTTYKTAGFFRRYFARLLDWYICVLMVLLSLSFLAYSLLPFFSVPDLSNPDGLKSHTFSVVALPIAALFLIPVLNFLYSWYFTHKFGGTIGKLLFGLRVVDETGGYVDKATAFWRNTAGYAVSSGFFGLGYFWAFRKKEDLTWHDRFFGTRVLTVRKPIWGIIALILLKILCLVLIVYMITVVLSPFFGNSPSVNVPVLSDGSTLL